MPIAPSPLRAVKLRCPTLPGAPLSVRSLRGVALGEGGVCGLQCVPIAGRVLHSTNPHYRAALLRYARSCTGSSPALHPGSDQGEGEVGGVVSPEEPTMGCRVTLHINPAHGDELAIACGEGVDHSFSSFAAQMLGGINRCYCRDDDAVDYIDWNKGLGLTSINAKTIVLHWMTGRRFDFGAFPQGSWGAVNRVYRNHPHFTKLVKHHFPEASNWFTSGAIQSISWS